MAVTQRGPRRALPPGRPPDPRGHGVRAATPRRKGFEAVWQAESRLVREATVPMAAFAAVTERDQGRLGRGRQLDAATRRCWRRRSPRSTTSRPAGSSSASARGGIRWRPKVGIDRDQPAAGDARDRRRPCARLLANETRHLRRRVRAPRRRRARLRAPGAPPEGRADLHRRHRHADDGAGRRDRRRRRAQLPRRRPPTTRRRWRRSRAARRGPAARSTTSTARSSSCARWTTTATPRSTRARAARHAVPRPAAAHHEGVRRAARRCSTRSAQVLTWPATHEQVEAAIEARARRDRAADHRVGHAPTSAGPRSREYVDAGCTCPILYPLGDDVPAMIDAFARPSCRRRGRELMKGAER